MMKPANILLLVIFPLFLLSGTLSRLATGDDKDKKNAEFRISRISMDSTGAITWAAFNQDGALQFNVEQYMNDRWVKVGEVSSIGRLEKNIFTYSPHLSSGENKFRLCWIDADKIKTYSNVVLSASRKEDVIFHLADNNLSISFSETVPYMIYDPYGTVVCRGKGNQVNISSYKCGTYCVAYDNKLATFEKKPVWFKNTHFPLVRENKPEHYRKTRKPFELLPP
jgi:hypothetical protein